MRYQELPNVSLKEADIIIQRVAFGASVSGQSGTQNAPDAILEISEQIEYYDEDMDYSPMQYMQVHVTKKIKKYKKIAPKTAALKVKKDQLLISLGGDHSITPQIPKQYSKNPLP